MLSDTHLQSGASLPQQHPSSVVAVTSPKLGPKKALAKASLCSPPCSAPSTPKLKASSAASSAAEAAPLVADLEPGTTEVPSEMEAEMESSAVVVDKQSPLSAQPTGTSSPPPPVAETQDLSR